MEPGGLQTSNPKKYRVRQPKPRKTKALVGKPETLQGDARSRLAQPESMKITAPGKP